MTKKVNEGALANELLKMYQGIDLGDNQDPRPKAAAQDAIKHQEQADKARVKDAKPSGDTKLG